MKITTKRVIVFEYVAYTTSEIDIPDDYPINISQWTEEQLQVLKDQASEEISEETAAWQELQDNFDKDNVKLELYAKEIEVSLTQAVLDSIRETLKTA